MPDIIILQTLRDVGSLSWNKCFLGEVENYEYLSAIEEAGIKGFSWSYVTAWEHGVLVAAMPGFITDYALDTTLQGTCKKITSSISSAFPNLFKLKMACLGSPCTEAGIAGFRPQLKMTDKRMVLRAMALEFERFARAQGCSLISVKDIPEPLQALWEPAIQALKCASLPGPPTAYLDIDFASIEDYMARLSSATRKDMRRKLKAAEAVEIRTAHSLDDVLPQLMALYHDTRNRSGWQFEELTADYFRGVLANMQGNSFCTLYYVQGQLLAANLLVRDATTLIDKFFCMNYEAGRKYNLYFLSWFTNIRFCLEHGVMRYQSGQAHYENKLRLGSKLTRNQMYFKHRNVFAQGVLRLAAPVLSADETVK